MKVNPKHLLLAVSIAYLAHELAFNARLCSVPLDQVGGLEYYGRTLAGCGAALVVARFLLPKLNLIPLGVILAVVFGLTFVGQRQVIEVLVDRTDGQERYDAQHLALLSSLMIEGKATVSGLDPDIYQDPARLRAYSSLLGLSTWADPKQMKQIRLDRHSMALSKYGQEAFQEVDSIYQKYLMASKKFNELAAKIDKAAPQISTALRQIAPKIHNTEDFTYLSKAWEKEFSKQADGQVVGLEAFCRGERRQGYSLGRTVKGATIYTCSTETADIARILKARAKKEILARFEMRALQSLPLEEPLSLEQWRVKLKPFAEAEVQNRVSKAMASPEVLQNGGEKELEGKSAARAVIVPPVAIAFSLFFSIFNSLGLVGGLLASKIGTLKALIYQAAGLAGIVAFPLIFGPPVIIEGLAGMVTKWVVTMEGWIYPLGAAMKFVTIPIL